MTRRGLVGLFLLPLAFAAMPLAAMAFSAAADSGPEIARIELAPPELPVSAPVDAETLGFSIGDHFGIECGFGHCAATGHS
jgi:hypothetical protein